MKQAGLMIVITVGAMSLPVMETVAQVPTTLAGIGRPVNGVVALPSLPGSSLPPSSAYGVAAAAPAWLQGRSLGVPAALPPPSGPSLPSPSGTMAVPPPSYWEAEKPSIFPGVMVRP
jgi:hypothetical protein